MYLHKRHCNPLCNTATHCCTLQRTATHLNDNVFGKQTMFWHVPNFFLKRFQKRPFCEKNYRNESKRLKHTYEKASQSYFTKISNKLFFNIFQKNVYSFQKKCLPNIFVNTVSNTGTRKFPQAILHAHCNTLQHFATHFNTSFNTLQHTATHFNTHCNTLQHTATHCNTLQHTSTHTAPQ